MIGAAGCGLLLAITATLLPAAAFAQSVAPNVPSYARPSYASPELVLRGRIVALGDRPDVEVSDSDGNVSDIVIAPGMTVMPPGLEIGKPVVVVAVRNASGTVATKIEVAEVPPSVDIAPPAPPEPIETPAYAPVALPLAATPAAVAPLPPSVRPQKAPRLAARVPHNAKVIATHPRLRPYQAVQHPKVLATVRRAPAERAPTPTPVRRVARPLVVPSPQEIAPTWYGWGKL